MQEETIHTIHVTNTRDSAYAAGVSDGDECRRRKGKPSVYLLVALDDYSAGFRAGYFQRVSHNPGIANTG
jgi:hypothetical protein